MTSGIVLAGLTLLHTLAPAANRPETAVVEAVAEARHDLDLGFTVPGEVTEVLVEPGDRVEKGQPLIRLDDRDGAAQIELFTLRAASTLEIEAAKAEWELAENEAKRLEEALSKSGAAPFEVERARLEAKRAKLAYELFIQRRDETALQLKQSKVLHERFEMTAPMAGTIENVVVEPGEMVEDVRPVLRMVVIDPLRIDAATPVARAATLKVGGPAKIRFRSSGREVAGTIVHVAAVADPGSETRAVRIDIPNPSGEPAGSHVEVTFPTE